MSPIRPTVFLKANIGNLTPIKLSILLLQMNIHAKVFIPKVVPEIPEGQSVPKVFQVCVCATGKLYAAKECESKFDQYC